MKLLVQLAFISLLSASPLSDTDAKRGEIDAPEPEPIVNEREEESELYHRSYKPNNPKKYYRNEIRDSDEEEDDDFDYEEDEDREDYDEYEGLEDGDDRDEDEEDRENADEEDYFEGEGRDEEEESGATPAKNPKCQQKSTRTSQCLSICCSKELPDFKCMADCEVVDTGNSSALGQLAAEVDGVKRVISSPFRTDSGQYTISGIIVAVILILTGLVFVFYGHRLFRPILFIAGFYVIGMFSFILSLGVFAYSLFLGIESRQGSLIFGDNRQLILTIIVIVAGLLGGALVTCLWKLGLFAIGMLLGFTLGNFILGFVTNGAIQSETGRIIFLAVLTIVGGTAILFAEKVLLVVATAFSGSYAVFFGIDVFANTGFSSGIQTFLSGEGVYVADGAVYGMLTGVLVLAVLGSAYQFRDEKRKSLSHRSAKPNKPGNGYSEVGVTKF